ncbi:MAG: HPr(Ser) kinase/phosphatase [Fibromonadaceae bacterium]|jgi:HPr kinase/phosphorylase|nr:HPr(Ser) kinase/phosphatase [Fibromonadaceae bacterium]
MRYKDLSQIQESEPPLIKVSDLIKDHGSELELSLKNNVSDSKITSVDLHRPGLALAGFIDDYAYEHIQLIGHTEWNYLNSVGEEYRKLIFSRLAKYKSPLWILTHGLEPFKEIVEMCETIDIPLAITKLPTVNFARPLQRHLENKFARKILVHGSMIDVFGVGALFVGDSGIGKSECVLDLIERGHCLVADDAIDLSRVGNFIFGSGKKGFNHYIEIRGMGIVDIREMFGVRSVRMEKRLDIILELQKWDPTEQYNRTGLDTITNKILGMDVPHVVIPVLPGKNIAVISEVVAMNYLLKKEGVNSARNIDDFLMMQIKQKMESKNAEAQENIE